MYKRRIYFACGFKTIEAIEDLAYYLRNDEIIKKFYELILPKYSECKFDSFVFSDLYHLENSHILIFHITDSSPSIGATMELAFFKTKFPHKLSIAYKSTSHGWVKHFTDIYCQSKEEIRDILITQILAHSNL